MTYCVTFRDPAGHWWRTSPTAEANAEALANSINRWRGWYAEVRSADLVSVETPLAVGRAA